VEGVAVGDLRVDAADGEVHLGQPPGGVVGLLTVDGDVADLSAVGFDKLLALHEHAARAAAGIIDAAFIRRQHLDQQPYHAGWGALAFRCDQRASFGTQKILTARYSSGSSGSAPSDV